jgi:transcriptional regulator with XRE-family HTH domain
MENDAMDLVKRGIGDRLYTARKKKGVSQIIAGADTGICTPTLSMYENGMRLPTLTKIMVLADYYGVSVGWLLGETDKMGRVER